MRHNTKKGSIRFKSTRKMRHGKTRRVQRGGATTVVKDPDGTPIGEYDDEGNGTATYPGVGVYVGHFENGVPHGQGKLIYEDGDVYEGEWHNDERNGQGTMTYPDIGVYKGNWENDERNGQGTMTYHGIGVYEGNWEHDERSGKGNFTFDDGRVYEGNWKHDERSGQGRATYKNGDVYEGEWQNNERNGQGSMTYANGDVYEGNFEDGLAKGLGKCTFINGNVYDGAWSADRMNGRGIMIYANGDIYDGEWSNDEKSGHGVMTYANGDVYEGSWWNDRRVNYNVSIARTTEEFMSMCSTAKKTQDECMKSECPICFDKFIDDNGRLLRPVMFHNAQDSTGKQIWSCPVHPEEQLKYNPTKCISCRADVFLTEGQKYDIAAAAAVTKLQSVIRGRRTRKAVVAKKVRQAQNRAAFNAAFPPSKMSRTRSNPRTRSNRPSADF